MEPTTLTKEDVKRFLPRVSTLVHRDEWIAARDKLKRSYGDDPFREFVLSERHHPTIALASLFERIRQGGSVPSIKNTELISGMQLSYMLAHSSARLSARGRSRLAQTIRGSFENNIGIKPICFELSIAHEFWQRGWRVGYEDLEDRAQFDFLIHRRGIEAEVECKHIRADTGFNVKENDFMNLAKLVRGKLKQYENQNVGLLIDITLEGKLGTTRGEHEVITNHIEQAVAKAFTEGKGYIASSTPLTINVIFFNPTESINTIVKAPHLFEPITSDLVKVLTGFTPEQAVADLSRKGRLTIISCHSRLPGMLLPTVGERLLEDSKRQLTRTRPALFLVQFANLSQENIESFGDKSDIPPGHVRTLDIMMTEFFARRPYVHTVGLFSREEIKPIANGYTTSGHMFVYPNRTHPLADNPLFSFQGLGKKL